MSRTDQASRVISASPVRVFKALLDEEALLAWLPPPGMTGRFERFDARPGGGYRMVLTYDDASGAPGESSAGEDVVEATFLQIEPGVKVVQETVFDSDDPAYAGTMTMTWQITAEGMSTVTVFRADGVPEGISAEDHVAGLESSLANLAAYVQ